MLQCETLGKFLSLYITPVHSADEYVATDSGGYMYAQPSCINCSLAGHVCQGVKCKAF